MDDISAIEKLKSDQSVHIRNLTLAHKEELTNLEESYIKKIVDLEKKINELTSEIVRLKSNQIGSTPISNAGNSNTPN